MPSPRRFWRENPVAHRQNGLNFFTHGLDALADAKILVHSDGLGAPHAALVRQRARELAQINGHEEYTEADWRQARAELHGAHLPEGEFSDEMAAPAMVSEADMLSAETGRHTGRVRPEDDLDVVEELWREGMEEAEHERMLSACQAFAEADDEPGA